MVSTGDAVGTAGEEHDLIYELRIGNKSVDPDKAILGSSGLQYRDRNKTLSLCIENLWGPERGSRRARNEGNRRVA